MVYYFLTLTAIKGKEIIKENFKICSGNYQQAKELLQSQISDYQSGGFSIIIE